MSGPNYDGRYGPTNGPSDKDKRKPNPCKVCGEPACYGLSTGQLNSGGFEWYCSPCSQVVSVDRILGR